jgi:S1-C subfamily serine protease
VWRQLHFPACLIALLALSLPAVAGDVYLGLKVRAEREGFFLNPVLKRVVITGSQPGSPAEKAGVLPDDVLVSINEHRIVGARASLLSAVLDEVVVGDRVVLAVDRAGAGTLELTLIAEPLPEKGSE